MSTRPARLSAAILGALVALALVALGVVILRTPALTTKPVHLLSGQAGFTVTVRPGQSWTWVQEIQNVGSSPVTFRGYEPEATGPVRILSVTLGRHRLHQDGLYLGRCPGTPVAGYILAPGEATDVQVRVQATRTGKFNIRGGRLTYDGGSMFFVGSQAGSVVPSAPGLGADPC